MQVGDLQSYLHLMLGIYNNGGDSAVDKDAVVLAGANSAITPLNKKKTYAMASKDKINEQKSYAITDQWTEISEAVAYASWMRICVSSYSTGATFVFVVSFIWPLGL